MTLGFKEYFPDGGASNFVQKIWVSLLESGICDTERLREYHARYTEKNKEGLKFDFNNLGYNAKNHTIREDLKGLWHPEKKIHPVINNHTADRFQFAPTFRCFSVQKIDFNWGLTTNFLARFPCCKVKKKDLGKPLISKSPCILIDRKLLSAKEVEILALNDGFESTEAFFKYFNKDFSGKIIHWTKLKY